MCKALHDLGIIVSLDYLSLTHFLYTLRWFLSCLGLLRLLFCLPRDFFPILLELLLLVPMCVLVLPSDSFSPDVWTRELLLCQFSSRWQSGFFVIFTQVSLFPGNAFLPAPPSFPLSTCLLVYLTCFLVFHTCHCLISHYFFTHILHLETYFAQTGLPCHSPSHIVLICLFTSVDAVYPSSPNSDAIFNEVFVDPARFPGLYLRLYSVLVPQNGRASESFRGFKKDMNS